MSKKITTKELQQIIKEGVERLHRKALIESRIEQINQELNQLSNPEAWEEARNRAQEELEKKTLNWRSITERPSGIIKEGLGDRNRATIQKWIDEYDYRIAAKKIIDAVLKAKIGLTSGDLADTVTFANGLDTVEEFLISGELDNAFERAKEAADEMIEEEGGMFSEDFNRFSNPEYKSDYDKAEKEWDDELDTALANDYDYQDYLDSHLSVQDMDDQKDVLDDLGVDDYELGSIYENNVREDVANIMGRASKLMEEAREMYNKKHKKD